MMDKVDFSVIIPTRNRKAYLKQAIESIWEQNDVSVEIVVVDDASEDSTPELVKTFMSLNYRINYIRNEKSVFAHEARRIGYKKAVGKFIVFMDDDDFYLDKSFFKTAKDILENNSNVSGVIASTLAFEKGKYGEAINLNAEGRVANIDYLNGFSVSYPKPMSTLSAVFRKSSLDLSDLANSKMVNDTCIFLYGILNGDSYLINRAVAAYRIHDNNISKKSFDIQFVKNCLREKIKIYNLACEKNLIKKRREWLYVQLSNSAFYFLANTKRDIIFIMRVFFWLMLHGKGTQSLFIKAFIKAFFARKYN